MRELRQLLRAVGSARRFAALLALRAPFDMAMTLVQAAFLSASFDAMAAVDRPALLAACLWFGVGSALLFLYNGTVWTLYAAFAVRWTGRLRRMLFRRIAGLSLRQVEQRPAGEWLTRLNADAQAASALLNQPLHLAHMLCSIVNLGVSAALLLRADGRVFALVALFVIPHLLLGRLVARPVSALQERALQAAAHNAADADALVTCADLALLYDAQGLLLERFERSSRELRRCQMALRVRGALNAGLLPLLGMAGYLALLLAAGSWIAQGQMTFGGLTAAFQYRGGVLLGAMMLVNCVINIRAAMAGVRRVLETLDMALEE